MVEYESNGDVTGAWNMYGHVDQLLWTMPLDQEASVTSTLRWPYFLPDWATKPAYPTIDDYIDAILKNFSDVYDRHATTLTIQSLPVPGYLQEELGGYGPLPEWRYQKCEGY